MSNADLRAALDKLQDDYTLHEIVQEAIKDAEWCCEEGCGSGACETCPCCAAGYCISGRDFQAGEPWPEDESLLSWLEIASEKNPVADKLRLALQELDICKRMLAEAVPE